MNIDNKINTTLFGLDNYYKKLNSLMEQKKFPKVFLLTGDKGIGKNTLIAHILNRYLKGPKGQSYEKEFFFDNYISNNLNNIFYFSAETDNLKIDKIREIRALLQKSNINNQKRFIIFDDIELLNINSINALLKIIEEPSDTNNFILINNKSKPLIDTIRSRCIELKLFIQSDERIEIIDNLLRQRNITSEIPYKEYPVSPGNALNYTKLCKEKKININDKLSLNVEKLINLYKKEKNYLFIRLSIFLINQFYVTKIIKTDNTNLFQERNETIKKVLNISSFNLNNKNILYDLKNIV